MFSISSLPNIVIKKLNKASTQNAIIQNRVKMVNRKEKLKRRLFDRKIRERRQQKFDNLRKKTT
jgi:PP-loop superfamily ATP-utilizing enzyme